jgi:tRNA (cytidine56-2'-O)-methyltransferase
MITVLRLGHRVGRDPRISTHCALVARSFGAEKIIYSGEHDSDLERSVADIVENWGGPFGISYEKNWRSVIRKFDGKKIHLTMYGLPVQKKIAEIRKFKKTNMLVIIGGQKVQPEVYHLADYNIAVTSQPHSEVAALALFLHELQQGREMEKRFRNAKIAVIPQERGKKTTKKDEI